MVKAQPVVKNSFPLKTLIKAQPVVINSFPLKKNANKKLTRRREQHRLFLCKYWLKHFTYSVQPNLLSGTVSSTYLLQIVER